MWRSPFDVLKTVDGIRVVDDTTVDGQPAVVLGIRSLFGYVSRVIVDPSNGTVVGEVAEFSLVPVVGPSVTTQTSRRSVLVDDIPADVRASAVHRTCTATEDGALHCDG